MITTIIETYLLSIDQATFQKMMNHLLHLEGNKFISSPGSVIGKNKTSKGSPDSFFEDGDNYAFCEYTTQEKLAKGQTFFKKLKSDIEHCFNIKATGISKNQISKIILAFNQSVSPSEFNELKGVVKLHNPNTILELYSIQLIPFKLVSYPGLADKYISGIKTTNGALYTLVDFIRSTECGIQPSLSNQFVGREDEIEQALEFLKTKDILILTGRQGVGKSKLAVQLLEIHQNELEYEPIVISNSPVPLWEDLNNFILPLKKYCIFFDDANKALPNLDCLLQFLNNRKKGYTKVVITVREYVRQDLNKHLENVAFNEIELQHFADEKLKEIINKYSINKMTLEPIVMERVLSLSKGNSRLALMATSSILQNNNISILKDVFSLYEQYFQKVKNERNFLDNIENLKALGILSFFGVLDRNDEEIKDILENHFKINWSQLWECFFELEKVELVDVFNSDIVKISDQVLATYVFYKTFIEENTAPINYSQWILIFIEKHEKKINKTLVDLINTFGFEELQDHLTSLIKDVQKKLEINSKSLLKFFEIFWFCREVDTLLFVKQWIENLEEEQTSIEDYKFTYNDNEFMWAPECFNLLLNFFNHNTIYTKDAIQLTLKLIFKQPSRIPETLKHLKSHFEFHRFDYQLGFPRQFALIEMLTNIDLNAKETMIYDQLFLSLAPSYLGWEFHQVQGVKDGQMAIYNFQLLKTIELMKLRRKILIRLFELFENNENSVLSVLNIYKRISMNVDSSVYDEEQVLISSFINKQLSPTKYYHCKFVFDYVNTLNLYKVKLLDNWTVFLNSEPMQISKLFKNGFGNKKLSIEKREQLQKDEIMFYIKDKDMAFIEEILSQLNSINENINNNNENHWIESGLSVLFNLFAEFDTNKYYKSLELLMSVKYSFELNYGNIIASPIKLKLVQPKELYSYINKYEYKQKQFWKQLFFESIYESDIDEFFLQEFVIFLVSLTNHFHIYNIEEFNKFNFQFEAHKKILKPSATHHANVITYIVEILLTKSNNIPISFDRQFCQKTFIHFNNHQNLLKKIYYLNKKSDSFYDQCGKEIAAISSLDSEFIIEYLIEYNKDNSNLGFKFDNLNLSYIWFLPDYEEKLDKALDITIAKSPSYSNFEHQANVFFKGLKLKPEQLEIVYSYISKFISKNSNSIRHIQVIMNVVTYRFNNHIMRFLKEFLLLNTNPEFIKSLRLEKSKILVNSSRIPRIEEHIYFIKSIIKMVKTLPNPWEYSEHLKIWEQDIEYSKQDIQRELKITFKGFY